MIEGETFTTSLYNASTSILCEPQRTDGQLRELQEPGIIGDGADNNGDLAFPLSLSVAYKLGQGQRRSVNPAHAQSFQNYAVERRTSPACQESIKLRRGHHFVFAQRFGKQTYPDQQEEVGILTPGVCSGPFDLWVPSTYVNTLGFYEMSRLLQARIRLVFTMLCAGKGMQGQREGRSDEEEM